MKPFALGVCAWLLVAPAATAEVQLSIRNGRVSIVAKDATVRQILAEWARVGKTKIINAERIPGGPVTLELKDVPEAEALDVLLRTLSGYMAAPRVASVPADASVYDSIAVMPTVAAAARPAAPAGAPAPFSPPAAFNQVEDDQDPNAPLRPGSIPPGPAVRAPIFSTFPAPQAGPQGGNGGAPRPMLPVVRPGVPQQPSNNPVEQGQQPLLPVPAPSSGPQPTSGFGGVSAPGMIAPAPGASQPGQAPTQRPNGE
jgi:hypothetical protein